MGFGLPAAVGAKVAAPDKIVIDIDGDASFSMTAMELATASQFNIGVKVLILNNEFQGMVLQWQGMFLLCFSLSTSALIRKICTRLSFPPQISSTNADIPIPRWLTPTLSNWHKRWMFMLSGVTLLKNCRSR